MVYFEFPKLLHLLWAVALHGLMLAVYWAWRRRTLRRLGADALAARLLLGFSARAFWIKNILFALALTCVAFALANPITKIRRQAAEQKSADVYIALDVSQSMLAVDEKPNRLEAAKAFIRKLVPVLEGERIGLILFAGDAFVQMPLSADYTSLLNLVKGINTDFITVAGTELEAPIDVAERIFGEDKEAGKALVIISDGEQLEGIPTERAREAQAWGMTIFTVGVGTPQGARIAIYSGGVKRDYTGEIVVSKMNEKMLRDLAQAGGGEYYRANDQALQSLDAAVARLEKKTWEAQAVTDHKSWFQWLILPALLFLVFDNQIRWKRN